MKRFAIILLLLSQALLAQQNFTEARLDNGLRILILPRQSMPQVWLQVWYGVGSKDELDGHTGLAHILEHMMFTGTKSVKDFGHQVSQVGGTLNATTSYDYTNYFELLPPAKLAQFMRLEADRMQNLVLTPESIKNELKAVQEERMQRVDNKLEFKLYEQAMAALHIRGPYHHLVIGWMPDIKSTKVTDIENWYHNWYSPNNALLVVAGPVQTKSVIKMVKKYFSDIKPKALPQRPKREDVALTSNVTMLLRSKSFVGQQLVLSYLAPSLVANDNMLDCYALLLLANILAVGKNSVLYHDLVNSGYATEVGVWYDMMHAFKGDISFNFKLADGKSADFALEKFMGNLQVIANGGFAVNDLNRAKAMVISQNIFAQDDFRNMVFATAKYAILGLKPQLKFDFAKKIKQVSEQDIVRVARHLLQQKYLQQIMIGV